MGIMSSDRIIRVIDLETTGSSPPAHAVCEIGWQDVVLQEDGLWAIGGEGGSALVDPGRSIPPVTMAVHHIMDEDVKGAPFWQEIAPTILRPEGGALALAAHRASFEQRFCTPKLSGGVVKCLIGPFLSGAKFSFFSRHDLRDGCGYFARSDSAWLDISYLKIFQKYWKIPIK